MSRIAGMFIAAAVPLTLGACAAQQREQAMGAAHARLIQECAAATEAPEFVPLRGKVPLTPAEGSAPPSLAVLADNAKPSPAEQKLLLDLDTALAPCRADTVAYFSQFTPPGVVQIVKKYEADNEALRARLYSGQISYGDAWNEGYQLRAASEQDINEYLQAMRSRQLQDRANAAAAYENTVRSMQATQPHVYVPVNPTVRTNCQAMGGGMVQCTSN